MSIVQIKKVNHVKVFNKFGKVEFLEPISLYKVDIAKIISIGQDDIHIVDPVLE
jgi:hypothetical protein